MNDHLHAAGLLEYLKGAEPNPKKIWKAIQTLFAAMNEVEDPGRGPWWWQFRSSHSSPRIAAVTNLPTVISFSSATSSCSSRKFHICLMSGGALSLVFSVTFSSLGVRNGHLLLSCVKRYPIESNCFSAAATFFLSSFGPLALLVELVIVRSILKNHRVAVRWAIAG